MLLHVIILIHKAPHSLRLLTNIKWYKSAILF